jgi:hypothetical protein
MIAAVWVGRMGASKADVSPSAAMKVIATLCNQDGCRTARLS